MTAIWIDPTELSNTADVLGSSGALIQETMTGTNTACTCEVPRSLIGWLDAELEQITVEALKVALAYLLEAIACKLISDQVIAEQSLVTTQSVSVVGGVSPFAATSDRRLCRRDIHCGRH